MIWVVVGVAIVFIGLAVLVASRRRTPDGVTTFQRQIDALSPEARRPVVRRLEDVANGERDKEPEIDRPGDRRDDGDLDGA